MATLSPSGLKTVNGLASPGQSIDDNLNLLNTRLGGDIIAQPITGLTGGGTTNLDGLVTAGVAVGVIVRIWNGTQLSFYRLTAGTTAESSPTVIRPDDYATTTNEKVWLLVSEQMNNLVARGALLAGVASSTFPVDLRGAAVLSAGVNMVGLIGDTTALAAGVGGGIGFVGITDGAGTARTFAAIAGRKENATSGDQKAACVLCVRPNAGDLIEFARGESGGNFLLRPPTTGLTGGGATNLDGIATLLLPAGTVVDIWNGNNLVPYRLRAGTDAESAPFIVRPDDYAATTNEKVWEMAGNRANFVESAGSDTLSGVYTDVDFGSGSVEVSAPSAGTYLVFAMVEFTAVAGTASRLGQAQIVRGASTVVANGGYITIMEDSVASRIGTVTVVGLATLTAADTFTPQAASPGGLVVSRAKVGYVRLF